MKFLCAWIDEAGQNYLTVKADFFCDDNGYSADDCKRITLLRVNDIIDLSDGISQVHTIERVL